MESNRSTKMTVLTVGGVAAGVVVDKKKPATTKSKNKQQGKDKNLVVVDAQTTLQPQTATTTTTSLTSKVNTGLLEYEETETAEESHLPLVVSVSGELQQPHSSAEGEKETKCTNASILPKSTTTTTTTTRSNFTKKHHELVWLFVCFLGIMASFVCYGLLLEYATSGGRKLHELSFLFVTSGLYTLTAAAGRYVRDETPTTIPPARFAVLGLTSMGSTFFSVRSLRYVIYPIQVLAKSCKPVPVMLMGALMGKTYPLRKYVNVLLIVLGVALFMGGGDSSNKRDSEGGSDMSSFSASSSPPSQLIGVILLFISLCFDGGTGAYEDKLMSVHSVQPFDLMYNIQLGKTILAGVGLLVLNELHVFIRLVQDMGFLLIALGLSGALGQVFIFVTIAKFGALTCSIIGLARKVTTLVASIYFYGHNLNGIQSAGLFISIASMVLNFWGKKKGGEGHGHGHGGRGDPLPPSDGLASPEELQKMLDEEDEEDEHKDEEPCGGEPDKELELGNVSQ